MTHPPNGNNILDSALPWGDNRYELISLGDLMKAFDGGRLVALYGFLQKIQGAGEAREDVPTGEETATALTSMFEQVQRVCEELALPASAEMARVQATVLEKANIGSRKIAQECDKLTEFIRYEMASHRFLYIEPTMARYYDTAQPFGEEVSARFHSTAFDIDEAGKCLALNRGTACVFHLMRVLEVGLYVLADDLAIQGIQENWQNAIEQIEKAIRDLDQGRTASKASAQVKAEWRTKKQFYSEAAAHFIHVKDAWRNRTAHIGTVYTVEKAQQIFESVKAFMQQLATQLTEKPL